MNIKRFLVLSILLIAILSIASAGAADNATSDAVELDNSNDKLEDSVEIFVDNGDELEIGADDIIDIEFPDIDEDLEGKLSVSVNGNPAQLQRYDEDCYYIINNGKGGSVSLDDSAELSIDKLTPGSYNLFIKFTCTNYPSYTAQKSVNIIVKAREGQNDDGTITVDKVTVPASMVAGEDRYLYYNGDVYDEGTLVVSVDGDEYARASVVNGKAAVSLSRLDDGDIALDVDFYDVWGDICYNTRVNIQVGSVKARLVGGKNIKMTYAGGNAYKLTVYGTSSRPAKEDEEIVFRIGKKVFYEYTNSKGVVSFKIPNSIAPGKYRISATYKGVTVKNTLIIKHALSLKKVKVKASAKKLVLKATVKKGLKGKVTFKFAGKKFKAKITKKGVAKVTVKGKILKKLKVGKKITYQATYIKDTVKRSVKVKA